MYLTPQQAQATFVPLMALSMSGIISLVLTVVNVGPVAGVFALWPRQWATAFAVALPSALVLVPTLRAVLARVTAAPTSLRPSPHSSRREPTP